METLEFLIVFFLIIHCASISIVDRYKLGLMVGSKPKTKDDPMAAIFSPLASLSLTLISASIFIWAAASIVQRLGLI